MKIIYEDNHILVVFKPKGIPVQSDSSKDLDMINLVKDYLRKKYDKKGNIFVGLVHRLDRMTFGLMVFAKTSKGASRLSNTIREKKFNKKYVAILCGNLNKEGKLVNYLLKDKKLNKSSVVNRDIKDSKEVILKYNILSKFKYNNKEYTSVLVDLITGRHHQIRVQFSNIGYPLYGDIKYGGGKGSTALCSYYLSFKHPVKDEVLEFTLDNETICNEYNLFRKVFK